MRRIMRPVEGREVSLYASQRCRRPRAKFAYFGAQIRGLWGARLEQLLRNWAHINCSVHETLDVIIM